MNIQVDEATLVVTVVSVAASAVGVILGGGWMLLSSFKKDVTERLEQSDQGLGDRQAAFMEMMHQHIRNEDRQFASFAQSQSGLQQEIARIREEYVTREYLEQKLLPILADTSQTKRIVDARQTRGADPVSGRGEDRRAGNLAEAGQ